MEQIEILESKKILIINERVKNSYLNTIFNTRLEAVS